MQISLIWKIAEIWMDIEILSLIGDSSTSLIIPLQAHYKYTYL